MNEAFQGEREIVVVMEHLAGDRQYHWCCFDLINNSWILLILMLHWHLSDFPPAFPLVFVSKSCFYCLCRTDVCRSGGELFDLVADEEFHLTEGQVYIAYHYVNILRLRACKFFVSVINFFSFSVPWLHASGLSFKSFLIRPKTIKVIRVVSSTTSTIKKILKCLSQPKQP